MLSALSPCLLQLAVYYAAVLAGTGAVAGAQETRLAAAKASLIRTSVFFVVGFTLVYTIGGVIAGYVGQSLEQLAGLQDWYRPVSFVAGVIIIVLAVRVAIQSKAPLVCKLPVRVGARNGWLSSSMMGFSFAIGCLSCFSATVLSALLLYAGSTGSPITGGLLLFLFSSGVGLIFLLAAWVMSRTTLQMTDWLQRARPILGGISALVMVLFGILMITYQFHAVSGFLFGLFTGA
ncbi:MAG: cytochrome c biogenesis protein CcdA, partial [Anaerolineae bacterium]|nr:cytochrome c biogenesis protein CcdA [Anaerolineae bacterium]